MNQRRYDVGTYREGCAHRCVVRWHWGFSHLHAWIILLKGFIDDTNSMICLCDPISRYAVLLIKHALGQTSPTFQTNELREMAPLTDCCQLHS